MIKLTKTEVLLDWLIMRIRGLVKSDEKDKNAAKAEQAVWIHDRILSS